MNGRRLWRMIGLVIIFKKQITTLLENIFKEINSQSKEVY